MSPLERLWKLGRRRPAAAALFLVVLLASTLAVAGLLIHEGRLAQQSARAAAIYRAGWESSRHVLLTLDDSRWADAPYLDDFRREQTRQFIPFFEAALAVTTGSADSDRLTRAQAHAALARLRFVLGDADASQRDWNEVVGILRHEEEGWPESGTALELLSDAYTKLGHLAMEAEKPREQLRYFELASDATRRLGAIDPDSLLLDWRRAQTFQNLGFARFVVGELASAERDCRKSLEIRLQISRDHPQDVEAQLAIADAYWALLTVVHDKPDEAFNVLEHAQALLEPLATPSVPVRAAAVLASFYVQWGNLLGRDDSALEKFRRADELLAMAREREPRSRLVRQASYDLYFARARLFSDRGRHAEALADWDRACELAPRASDARFCRARRVTILAGAGQIERALDEAEALLGEPVLEPETASAAAYSALAVSRLAREASAAGNNAIDGRCNDLAVQFLRRAVEGGFFREPARRKHLIEDEQYAPLRERADFRALFAGLAE